MQTWEFSQTWDQCWYWRRLRNDGTFEQSPRPFDSRLECVADAFEHGYCSPSAEQSIFLSRDLTLLPDGVGAVGSFAGRT